jgi:hypothetical protein
MDRRQKIMKLVVDSLTGIVDVKYSYLGSTMLVDPDVISLDFMLTSGQISGSLNIRGVIDGPLTLKAEYDNHSVLNSYPFIQQRIGEDLSKTSRAINKLL